MKPTRRSLLTSAICLFLTAVMLMGSTFAWFTDSVTNTGNKIEAGKLDIGVVGYRLQGNEWGRVIWQNELESSPLITETNWEPGQYGAVLLWVSNYNSTLAAKVDIEFSASGELADALWYKLTAVQKVDAHYQDDMLAMLQFKDSRPTTESADVNCMSKIQDDPTEPLTLYTKYHDGQYAYYLLEYGMYTDVGNEYQNKSFDLTFTVKATQAPVETDGFGHNDYDSEAQWPDVQVGGTTQELVAAVEAAKPGDVLQLAPVTYQLTSTLEIPNGVTLLGANAGVPASEWYTAEAEGATKIVTAPGASPVIKIEQDAGESVNNVVLDGILVDGNGEYTKGIQVKKNSGDAMTGIVIRNCAVVNCGNDGIDVNNTNGAIIENNYVDGVYDNGIQLSSYNNTQGVTAYIRNNVVKNVGGTEKGGTINGAIAVSGGKGDVVVSGNLLENIRSDHQVAAPLVDMGESAIVVESVYEGGVITIENNTLTNVEQGIAVYKFSAPSTADKVVIRNNTITDGATFCIATSTLNYKNLTGGALVEIVDNTFTNGAEPDKGEIYVEQTNRYNESTTGWQVTATGNTSGNGTYTPDAN